MIALFHAHRDHPTQRRTLTRARYFSVSGDVYTTSRPEHPPHVRRPPRLHDNGRKHSSKIPVGGAALERDRSSCQPRSIRASRSWALSWIRVAGGGTDCEAYRRQRCRQQTNHRHRRATWTRAPGTPTGATRVSFAARRCVCVCLRERERERERETREI